MEYVELISKCIFFYLIIIISLRVMGKREVGELSVLDIVIYFVMSEVYALSISEPDQSIWKALIAILTLTVLQILIAWACLKKKKWRDFFEGKPSLIIYNGMIDQMEMKKQRYTIDDLMYQLRDKDISTPEEVQFAILENSGTLTVLKKDASKLKWKDPLISTASCSGRCFRPSARTRHGCANSWKPKASRIRRMCSYACGRRMAFSS